MGEWYDNQTQSSSDFRKLLQERIEKANPRRELTDEETMFLNKLEAIAEYCDNTYEVGYSMLWQGTPEH